MLLYGASSLLDVADGYAARTLNQSSEFGAVLDMVTDRYCIPAPTPAPQYRRSHFWTQMRNVMSIVLPCFYIPRVCPPLSVPHHPRLFQPLHAHVQVRHLFPFRLQNINYHFVAIHSTLTTGSRRHKSVKSDVSRILSWYYKKVRRGLDSPND